MLQAIFCFGSPATTLAQKDLCQAFNKVKTMMETGFSSAKGTKITESTTNYGAMIITKRSWTSTYNYPEALVSEITEILKVAPDPKNAGHNIYISFNFAKNSTRPIAEAIFTRMRDALKLCSPANWKVEERSGNTYARYSLMDGSHYDESPHKITLQFSKLEGPGEKYTADLIFDSAVK